MKIVKYLQAVKVFCNEKEKMGLTTVNHNFPSFRMGDTEFRQGVIDFVTQRVNLGISSESYNNVKKINKNLTYSQMLKLENKVFANTASPNEIKESLLLQEALLKDMLLDKNLDSEWVKVNGVRLSIEKSTKNLLLESLFNKYIFEDKYLGEVKYDINLNKIVATLMIVNKNFPDIYEKLKDTFLDDDLIKTNTKEYQTIIKDLKKRSEVLNFDIAKILNEYNPIFLLNKYPEVYDKWIKGGDDVKR